MKLDKWVIADWFIGTKSIVEHSLASGYCLNIFGYFARCAMTQQVVTLEKKGLLLWQPLGFSLFTHSVSKSLLLSKNSNF